MVDFSNGPQNTTCLVAKSSKEWLWHIKLGHVCMRNLAKLVKDKHVLGIKEVKFDKDQLCGACHAGKQIKSEHPTKNIMTTTSPLELLHIFLVPTLTRVSEVMYIALSLFMTSPGTIW